MKRIQTIAASMLILSSIVLLFSGCKQNTELPEGDIVVGGYGESRDLTREEHDLFLEATKDYVDQGFEPLTVSTQVVAGKNYRFYCKATPTNADGTQDEPYYVYVTIYQSLKADEVPVVTGVEKEA